MTNETTQYMLQYKPSFFIPFLLQRSFLQMSTSYLVKLEFKQSSKECGHEINFQMNSMGQIQISKLGTNNSSSAKDTSVTIKI